MNSFSFWIVVLDPSVQKEISTILLNSGFAIKALSSSGKICGNEKDKLALGYTFSYVISTNEDFNTAKIRLFDIIDKNKIQYFFRLFSISENSCWNFSSIKINRQLITDLIKNFPELATLL